MDLRTAVDFQLGSAFFFFFLVVKMKSDDFRAFYKLGWKLEVHINSGGVSFFPVLLSSN